MQPKTYIIFLLLLLINFSSLFAVSPAIRLPEWHESKICISEWNPEKNQLGIKVELKAVGVDLVDVSCGLSFNQKITEPEKKDLVSAGDTVIFVFNLRPENKTGGWIDIDLRARPDKSDLIGRIEKMPIDAISHKLALNEAQNFDKPVMIGTSFPVFIAQDIAMGTTPDMVFRPLLKLKNRPLYIWLPPENIGSGLTAESFKALRKAIKGKNYSSAAAACKLLMRRITQNDKPVEIKKANNEKFFIQGKILNEILAVNEATLIMLEQRSDEALKAQAESVKTPFVKAFALFNLGQFNLASNHEGRSFIEQAVSKIPSWPLAKKILKEN